MTTNRPIRNFTSFSFAIICALGILTHHADADNHGTTRPVVQIGHGIQTPFKEGGLNILMKVGFALHHYTDKPAGRLLEREYQEQLIVAHLSGDFAISTLSDGSIVPFIDIQFIPIDNHLEFINTPGEMIIMGNLRFLPTEIKRNLQIDQQLGVKVAAVGIQLDAIKFQDRDAGVFAQLAVDALGYKMVDYVSAFGTFKGFHIAQAALEVGYARYIKDDFLVRVMLGGSADINVGKNSLNGGATQSDQQAYIAVKANIKEMIELYVKVGYMGNTNSRIEGKRRSTPMLLGGASFIF
jgi:hypothetical protein